MRKAPLILIDLQNDFTPPKSVLLEAINQIKLSRSVGAPILVVEYATCGEDQSDDPTHNLIRDALWGYANACVITKFDVSGADEVKAWLKKNAPKAKTLKAMGVYTDACVKHTVVELARRYDYKIKLIRDGCASVVRDRDDEAFEDVLAYPGITEAA